MDCFCLGIPIGTITIDIINTIRNDPLIIFYQAGTTSYVCWNVVLEVGCLKPIFDRWMASAPWTALLASFQRLSNMTGVSTKFTFGNIRVYLKYSLSVPSNLISTIFLSPDNICYGIQIQNVNQTIINAVRNTRNIILYISGDSHYLTHRVSICTGALKPEFDAWFISINVATLINEINYVLTSVQRKNIGILDLKLYGQYQMNYPYAIKIQHYAHS